MIPEVSIIIVSYNKPDILLATLRSVTTSVVTPACEVIVVDNASGEKNVEMVRKSFPEVRLVESRTNGGFGSGCNLGAHNSSGKYLLFVNSDVLLEGNPVPGMVALFGADPGVGIVGCQLRNGDGSLQPSYFRFPGLALRFLQLSGLKKLLLAVFPAIRFREGATFPADMVSGAFFMIPSDLFAAIGGFDTRYFMYAEDADICFQVRRKGRRVVVYNTTDVVHLGVHYEDVHDPFLLFHYNRSQIMFYRKNYSAVKLGLLALMTVLWMTADILQGSMRGRSRQIQDRLRAVRRMYLAPLGDLDNLSFPGVQPHDSGNRDL
jgi:N-acetylglucosaminyl-diphospho-decaprenol L-rhamnosyltransferase